MHVCGLIRACSSSSLPAMLHACRYRATLGRWAGGKPHTGPICEFDQALATRIGELDAQPGNIVAAMTATCSDLLSADSKYNLDARQVRGLQRRWARLRSHLMMCEESEQALHPPHRPRVL